MGAGIGRCPSAGHYDVICRIASTTGGKFHLEFNGINVTGPIEVKATGTADTWTDVQVPHVAIIAGDQYMKLFAETDSIDIKSIQMCKE